MSKTKEILVAAKSLISNERNWCQGSYSKKKEDGTMSYCAMGAIHSYCVATQARVSWFSAINALRNNADTAIADFNDSHTHTEVMELFDKAIASAE